MNLLLRQRKKGRGYYEENIMQDMEVRGLTAGKMMTCIICFVHITTATTPLPNQ